MPSLTTSQKVAIAVSVPLAAVLLYVFIKWSREDEEFEESEEHQEMATTSDSVLELKIPQSHTGTVIGRGGSTIKQIQKESQTRINVKKEEEESEGEDTDDEKQRTRTIVIRGSRERTQQAELLIRKVIAEKPVVEKTTVDIPQRVIGRLIGKGGKTIRQLCRISGAKLKVNRDDEVSDIRKCEIVGTETQIECAKQLIHEKIYEDKVFRTKQEHSQEDNAEEKLVFAQLPTDGDYFGMYVSAIDSPGQFWIQKVTKDSKQLDDLVEDMTVYYGDKGEGYMLNQLKIGDLCSAPFQHDRSWYRGEITDVISASEVQIYYLDFGDSGRVSTSNVRELRKDFREFPFQAIECRLANIKPNDGEWNQLACDLFEKLSCCAQWKVLMGRVLRYDNGVPCIELFDTHGEEDINIEDELVKQGAAMYTEDHLNSIEGYQNETPSTSHDSSQSQVHREPTVEEKPITSQEVNQQYQSFNFEDESWEADDSPSFEFVSPGIDTKEDNQPGSVDDTPLSSRQPVHEPAVSAVEHTVVSCADLSKLPTLLDWEGSEENSKELEKNYVASGILVSTPNNLSANSSGQSDDSTVKPALRNVIERDGVVGSESPSGSFLPPVTVSTEKRSENQQADNEIEFKSMPEVYLQSEPEVDKELTVSSGLQLDRDSETDVATLDTNLKNEQGRISHGSENEHTSPKYVLRRSLSDGTTNDRRTRELTRSNSETVVSPESNEVDGRTVPSSRSVGSLQGHTPKAGKRLLAPKFNKLQSCNDRQESENDEIEDEEDDDSLYLSAREDSDSTGFVSAAGSSINLRSSDSDSDVTPSGYLSDPDEEWNGPLDADEIVDQTRLDNTLLAEKLEQYGDKVDDICWIFREKEQGNRTCCRQNDEEEKSVDREVALLEF